MSLNIFKYLLFCILPLDSIERFYSLLFKLLCLTVVSKTFPVITIKTLSNNVSFHFYDTCSVLCISTKYFNKYFLCEHCHCSMIIYGKTTHLRVKTNCCSAEINSLILLHCLTSFGPSLSSR